MKSLTIEKERAKIKKKERKKAALQNGVFMVQLKGLYRKNRMVRLFFFYGGVQRQRGEES